MLRCHGAQRQARASFRAVTGRHVSEGVENILGSPAETVPTKDGNQTAIYIYERGNERSIVRAVIHLFMDIITFGFWEIPATAAEGSQGEERRFPIVYGPDGTVLLLNEYGNLS